MRHRKAWLGRGSELHIQDLCYISRCTHLSLLPVTMTSSVGLQAATSTYLGEGEVEEEEEEEEEKKEEEDEEESVKEKGARDGHVHLPVMTLQQHQCLHLCVTKEWWKVF